MLISLAVRKLTLQPKLLFLCLLQMLNFLAVTIYRNRMHLNFVCKNGIISGIVVTVTSFTTFILRLEISCRIRVLLVKKQ